MDQPPPLNVIQLGKEWLATNGQLDPAGTIHFPHDDPAEEIFVHAAAHPTDQVPGEPSAPSSGS